jgi:hypothetical protein
MSEPLPPNNKPDAQFFFDYHGWNVFLVEDDHGQGKVKGLYFAVNKQTAEQKEIDISPYGYPNLRLMRSIIEMGFPKRIGPSPLSEQDLDQIITYGRAAE